VTPPQEFAAPPFKPGVTQVARTLELAAPLAYALGGDSLDVVTFTPNPLPGDTPTFTIAANATGHAAGLYHGTVNLLDPTGALLDSVPVFVLV
jgi:hypothetical protein